MSTLIQVSTSEWIIEGHTTSKAAALNIVRTYLTEERGLDEWDADDAIALVRVDRTWYSDTAGFVYAGYADGRPVVVVTGLPPLPGTVLPALTETTT